MKTEQGFPYSVYELSSGIVIRSGYAATMRDVHAQVVDRAKEGVVNELLEIDAVRVVGTKRKYRDKPVELVTKGQVKNWAGRLLSYTDWAITRFHELGTPVPEAITAERTQIRAACAWIEEMSPIPQDYRSPKWWYPPKE